MPSSPLNDTTSDRTHPEGSPTPDSVPVWDPATRLFHWLLVAFAALAFLTGKTGGIAMARHPFYGEVILALVIFRLAWGFVGSETSRFSNFLKGPSAVLRYSRTLFSQTSPRHVGHNPLGGWSVAAMLLCLFVQAATGLFATDDIFVEGPLFEWVGRETSEALTRLHRMNHWLLAGLAALHVSAIGFYLVFKGQNLIGPMVTGRMPQVAAAAPPKMTGPLKAALVFIAAAAGVYLLVG